MSDVILDRANLPQLSTSELLLKDAHQSEAAIALNKAVAEFAGTLGAGGVGTATYSLLPKGISLPLRVLAAAAGGSVTKFGVKGGLELGLLNEDQRTLSATDLAWGAIDGLSGVAASAAEKYATKTLSTNLGYRYAGTAIGKSTALQVGEKVLEGSVYQRVKQNSYRGMIAGFAGSLAYSTPHAISDNFSKLNTAEGWLDTGKDIGKNTAFGTAFGFLLSGTITAAANRKEIYGYAKAAVQGNKGLTQLDILHFNDLHSSLVGERASLPQIASKADELRASAQSRGSKALLFDLGDNYSGNVVAGFTDVGYVETAAIQKMKVDAFIPGNHVADVAFGDIDVQAWARNMERIKNEAGRELPAIATNISVPKLPGFVGPEGVYKPYRIVEAADGKKIGLIGTVTKDLEHGSNGEVVYSNAKAEAEKAIADLNKQGIKEVVILSHMGRAEDVALAQTLNAKVAAIIGAHSHDIEPVPIWVRGVSGNDIPIVQAGSKGGWLGELNLVFKDDGTADKYRSFGRLHEIGAEIKAKPEILQFINKETDAIAERMGAPNMVALKNTSYENINISESFSMSGIRGQFGVQTPLGTITSKGLLQEVNERLGELNTVRAEKGLSALEPMTIMLRHTGDIRHELPTGTLTHLNASNVFLNTGHKAYEIKELAAIQLTGDQLKRVLNFGVSDLAESVPVGRSIADGGSRVSELGKRLKSLVEEPRQIDMHDYSGHFLMGDGIRYTYDRAAIPGQRIKSLEVFDARTNKFMPVDSNAKYNVLTRFHPVDKWGRVPYDATKRVLEPGSPELSGAENWVFGRKLSSDETRKLVNAQPVELSQVDLLVSFLGKESAKNGGTLSPRSFASDVAKDLTVKPWTPPLVLGRNALTSLGATAGFRQYNQPSN